MEELNIEHKLVYPLFQKASRAPQVLTEGQQSVQPSLITPEVDVRPVAAQGRPNGADKRAKNSAKPPAVNGAIEAPTITATIADNGELSEVDPNNARRKRQKTNSPRPSAVNGGVEARHGAGEQTMLGRSQIPTPPISDQVPCLTSESNIRKPPANLLPSGQDKSISQWCQGIFFARKEPAPVAVVAGVQNGISDLSRAKMFDDPQPENTIDGGEESKRDSSTKKKKKILHLNPKTGTIGSPPSKKPIILNQIPEQDLSKKRAKKAKSLMVAFRYGPGQPLPVSVGLKIDQILKSSRRISPTDKGHVSKSPENTVADSAQPAKALHPLFLGKAAKVPIPVKQADGDDQNHKTDLADDPAIPEAVRSAKQLRQRPLPRSSASSPAGLGMTAKAAKYPGPIESAWPWRDMQHIRGYELNTDGVHAVGGSGRDLPSTVKKSKYQAVEVLAQEDTLNKLATQIDSKAILTTVREIRPDKFAPIPSCLRVPVKHLESGLALQRRVQMELRASLSGPHAASQLSTSEDELNKSNSTVTRVHQALTKIYDSIPTSLSAFDRGECEPQAWIHKYSPKAAAIVLQIGREGYILKEWLQTLTVKAVGSGATDGTQSRSSSLSRRSGTAKSESRLPKKRKSKKLEDFVVSTDDDEDDMDEISEPEDDVAPFENQGLLKKTVIRAGDLARGARDSGKLTNAIVISGPHGCGKTAAVYAVAKELGFEVFEINASSRRSGKDILEKVGDMTRNHLVQRSQHQASGEPIDEDAQRESEALANEIKSGRQGTMNSFFKPQASTKPKAKPKKAVTAVKDGSLTKEKPQLKLPPKPQKQSLILLEEVDVLYEEDKQFWATVISLIAQSKRPVIMTCNDETLVPFQTLSLHAIIRFTPPPVDLAVDYMLLIAACEGHVIKRDAVKALYESRDQDLRASLTELDFWCQFAIGDKKNGLGWYYSRWPIGKDVNDHGDTLRVVSEGSFETGMGWLSRDFLENGLGRVDMEEQMLHEAWEGWHLDVADLKYNRTTTSWNESMQTASTSEVSTRDALYQIADLSEALSAADIFSGAAFASKNQILIDSTLPQLTTKVREDYILGRDLLEAPPVFSYDSLGTNIALWIKSRPRDYHQLQSQNSNGAVTAGRTPELDIEHLIRTQSSTPDPSITRQDFSLAFDPISEPEKTFLSNTGVLEPSIFDRTMAIIATDVAPYVRSIVAYDTRLQEDRARMSNLLSEGGRRTKRMRTTRAALSALEGGARSTTRRDKYFGNELNPYFVLRTGKQEWLNAVMAIGGDGSLEETRLSKGDGKDAAGDLGETGSAGDETDGMA